MVYNALLEVKFTVAPVSGDGGWVASSISACSGSLAPFAGLVAFTAVTITIGTRAFAESAASAWLMNVPWNVSFGAPTQLPVSM